MLKEHIVKAHPQRPMPVELMGPEPSSSGYPAASADSNDSMEDIREEGEIDMDQDELDEEDILPNDPQPELDDQDQEEVTA